VQVPAQLYVDGELRFVSTSHTVEVSSLKKGEVFKSKELDLLGPSFEGRSYIIDNYVVVQPGKGNPSIVRIYLKTV
jgi:translation elongation factor P/translation initiation factor 5A